MRTHTPLVLGLLSLAACASVQSGGVPLSPATYDDAARDAFFDALRQADDDAAIAALAKTPALASARSTSGSSAFLVALTRLTGITFVPPQSNRALAAIVACHPPLDPFEAAAAGDVPRVIAEAESDASYVKRVHALGWTPLHFAAFGGQPRVVEALVARGADVDAQAENRFGNTPLQVGLLTGQRDVTRVLIAHRAQVNFRQKEGVTALHEAAQWGDVAIVAMLLGAGADPSARTGALDDGTTGKTAADLARAAGHDAVVALLAAREVHR